MAVIMTMSPKLSINFDELKASKAKLLKIIGNAKDDELDGIVNLIDTIQDHAVDELGVSPRIVFNLE